LKSESQKRRKVSGVRVAEDEERLFQALAQEQRMSVSEFLRTSGVHQSLRISDYKNPKIQKT